MTAAQYEQLQTRAPEGLNPFIDRAGYLAHIDMQEGRFEEMLKAQQAGAR